MPSRGASAPRGSGLIESLRSLGTTVLELIRARAELISIELQEEKERRKEMLVLATVGVLFIGIGLFLVALSVVIIFWDTYRLPAAIGVTLLYLGIGGWAFVRLRQKLRNHSPPFTATLREFERDMEALRGGNE